MDDPMSNYGWVEDLLNPSKREVKGNGDDSNNNDSRKFENERIIKGMDTIGHTCEGGLSGVKGDSSVNGRHGLIGLSELGLQEPLKSEESSKTPSITNPSSKNDNTGETSTSTPSSSKFKGPRTFRSFSLFILSLFFFLFI